MSQPPRHAGSPPLSTSNRSRHWRWGRTLLTLLALTAVWSWASRRVDATLRTNLESSLTATVRMETEAVRLWARLQRGRAEGLARESAVGSAVATLLADGGSAANAQAKRTAMEALRNSINPEVKRLGYQGFAVADLTGRVLGGDLDELQDQRIPEELWQQIGSSVKTGATAISAPHPSRIMLPDGKGGVRAGTPTMFVVAHVYLDGRPLPALLGLRISPARELSEILSIARVGASGETYAFTRQGLLINPSRFEEELRTLGLLPEGQSSALQVALRDPGVDLRTGARSTLIRAQQPLTRAVAEALAGREGVDVQGYRDYRGVEVFGAWRWLPELAIGIATEVDVTEARKPLETIHMTLGILFGLLTLSAVTALLSLRRAEKLAIQARQAVVARGQLGPYALEERLGAGGMGVVHRARHAMLQRPVAVKFLHADRSGEKAIQRFEREVQLTSRLSHPNTIAIYDYGRTPEGVFYYVMECLEGITLDELVRTYGPQPEGRVVHILRQVCASLSEAHEFGLIHRDVKPANVMLGARGGVPDFVKVLDFGLAKAADGDPNEALSQAGGVLGTPHYMAPEVCGGAGPIDGRVDLYAVGSLGYFLVTGRPPFEGSNALEILRHHTTTPPQPPSALGAVLSPGLESLLLMCLAKLPGERPASARELAAALGSLPSAAEWTEGWARAWWRARDPAKPSPQPNHEGMVSAPTETQD